MPVFALTTAALINILVLLSGFALIIGGVAFIASGATMRRDILARRADLIRPRRDGVVVGAAQRETGDTSLIRVEVAGLPVPVQREVTRLLGKLGIPARHVSAVFTGLRLLLVVGAGLLGLIIGGHISLLHGTHALIAMVGLALGIGGWFLPLLILHVLVKQRARAVVDGLPDALELLVVCVEAGLALGDAIDRIIGELRRTQPALAEELAQTSADLKIMPSRDQALSALADRVDMPSIRSLVATLSQTMRYGTPLARAMRVVAAEMRTDSLINLEERANRLPALMTVPMMIFIMPTIFLIVGGPAALRLIDMLSR